MGSIIILGGGAMGGAFATGLLNAGHSCIVVEPDSRKHPALSPVPVFSSIPECFRHVRTHPRTLLLAVKPQVFPQVAEELRSAKALEGAWALSIMAGITLDALHTALPGAATIVRAMPNLPARIGMSCTAFSTRSAPDAPSVRSASEILRAVGPAVFFVPEELMDAFTAVAGSGPAYLFLLAEAMEAGARETGFDALQARAIVRATLAGASALLDRTPQDAQTLRSSVTSKGGTTEAALAFLESAAVPESLKKAILAARDRARALGSHSKLSAG